MGGAADLCTMPWDKFDAWLKILDAQIKKDQTNYCDSADLKQKLAAWQMYLHTRPLREAAFLPPSLRHVNS